MNKSSDYCLKTAADYYDKDTYAANRVMQYAFYYLAYALVMVLKEFLEVYKTK